MTATNVFASPGQERYFVDYIAGAVHQFGSVTVDQDEVIEFAKRYDPQVFHIDIEKAKHGPYGGLIASGWHTSSMAMNLLTQYYLSDVSSLGSPGISQLHWFAPVRPGDTLSVRVTTTGTRRSKSRPERGIVESLIEVLNQDGVIVMDFHSVNFIACRSMS